MAAEAQDSASEMLRFEAGRTVFKEGDPGDTVYVVLDGKVDLRVAGRLVETVGPGGVLGEMALIEQAPRVATATARTACDLQPISEARFMSMIQQTPHFALQIMKVIASRLRRMNVRLMTKKAPSKRRTKRASRSGARPRRSSRR
ncbi:MAG TPA: cyclic nucleotide-binding domain-containing protein [Burkholderiales bacterium]|nr:cyclic nucleotide-binding domain-containing protein [Burkholderiales bacterium]